MNILKNHFHPKLPVRRDNHILEHVFRMGMTTPQVLHRLFFAGKTINAVTQATKRLVKDGYLNKHPLWTKSIYFTLGNRCVRLMGTSRSKTTPRGEQALPIDLGALGFCCLQEQVRRRLLAHELIELYPWFPKQFLCHPYCLVTDGGTQRLAIIKTEMTDFPDQVLRKHQKQFHALRECKPFAELVDSQQFMVVTVTTTPERRGLLQAEFDADPWYPTFAVFDFPDLCNLL